MRQQKINSQQLIKIVEENKYSLDPDQLMVEGSNHIDCKKIKLKDKHFRLKSMTFTDLLYIENFEGSSIIVEDCNFTHLEFWQCKFEHLSIIDSAGEHLDFFGCEGKSVYLRLETDKSIDLSGLKLSEYLKIEDLKFEKIELFNPRVREQIIKTPYVETEDPVIMLQFKLAGIPVHTSTEAVRKVIESFESKDGSNRMKQILSA